MSIPDSWKEVCESKAVIMGLKRYAFRREYSAARLAAAGFTNIEYVDAFDAFYDDVDSALAKLGVAVNRNVGTGQKGCLYTHMREWKRMIDENIPYRVFFEDDALGHLDLPNGLGQTFWSQTPKDFDILYLGNMMDPFNNALKDPNALVVSVPSYTTHALIVSLEGAKKFFALAKEMPIITIDIQLLTWQIEKKIKWYCWNGTWVQKSFPTFDEGLPWQAFSDVILPEKDTGLFWQNMRLGTTLTHPTLQLTVPKYNID